MHSFALMQFTLRLSSLILLINLQSTLAHANDRYSEIRASLGPNEELVMIEIPENEVFPIANESDPSDPKTKIGICFGIVHLEQKLSALDRNRELFAAGPRDSDEAIKNKLMAAARGEKFEAIAGFSKLSDFYADSTVQSILKDTVKDIQKAHTILTADAKFKTALDNANKAPEVSGPFALMAEKTGSDAASVISERINSGKSVHLALKDSNQAVGHSVRVVGYIRDKETKEVKKIIVQDSNRPEEFQVIDKTEGQWTYPLAAGSAPQPVMIAAVEDDTEFAPGQKIMTELPRVLHEKKSEILAGKAQPYLFQCQKVETDQPGLARLFELGSQ